MSLPQQRERPARWSSNMAKQTLCAPMPSRTDSKSQAVLANIDQHPSLAMLPPEERSDFVKLRRSMQLKPGPKNDESVETRGLVWRCSC